ncbi:MAG: DNA topoisomerase IV subunit A [Planctomycetales bacterium]|nr:DNA topoisomerase IV subunit A [Planctomycetales bacterium]
MSGRRNGNGSDKAVIARLEGLGRAVAEAARKGKNPTLEIPIRALSNVKFNDKRSIIELGDETQSRLFLNVAMAKKFMQTMLVAAGCKEFVESGKTTSLRDLFYRLKHTLPGTTENTFDEQEESDPIIEDVEVTLDTLREELHLFASRKGSMVGPITIRDSGDQIDLARMGSGGWAVPSIVEPSVIQFVRHEAKYVLLIEKEAVWVRFNEDKFWKREKCIILQSGGQPPRGVRRLVQRLVNELKLPLFVLVDNDPWGLYIYSVVKQGSINLAYESMRMAVPAARFIGLSTFDREEFKIAKDLTIALDEQDRSRTKQMLDYPWFQKKPWQRELKEMLASGVKMELEALSTKRNISFITEEYLPRKLKEKKWLD